MKTFTLLFCILVSNIVLSQERVEKFELKKDGFPDFVVVEFDGKTANDIYVQVQKWAQYNIRNAEVSNYSEIQDEYLTYTIDYIDAFKADDVIVKQNFDVLMDVELRIKDEKLRIDLKPKQIRGQNGDWVLPVSGGMSGILKKDGRQRKQKVYQMAFEGMNNLANSIVKDFTDAVNGNTDYKKTDW